MSSSFACIRLLPAVVTGTGSVGRLTGPAARSGAAA